jgi:DNA (cytosine-5)-methyltransferase 1
MGLHRAGFKVVGFDIEPQKNYPFEFHQADALTVDLSGFDAVWASPPCQAYSFASRFHPERTGTYPDLIPAARAKLEQAGLPFIIENVPGAPVQKHVVLCGEMFGLRVHRHRYFETGNAAVFGIKHGRHRLNGALNNCQVEEGYTRLVAGHYSNFTDACDAMGIDWMSRSELAEAIPPAYSEYLGTQLIRNITE